MNRVSKLNLLHQCAEKLLGRVTESHSSVAVELSSFVESSDAVDMPHRVSLFSRAQLRQHKRARMVHEKNLTPIFYLKINIYIYGKIQGDGRKFLDSFKSYFGSQISSQSLSEVYIYQLQPKSATKEEFFRIFLSFELASVDCKWRTKSTKCC